MRTLRPYLAVTALGCAILISCATPPPVTSPSGPVYEIVAQGAAHNGGGAATNLAIRGEAAAREAPDGLPTDVIAALQEAAQDNPTVLYVVVYAGMKPGGGYGVSIDSMELAGPTGTETLVVVYSETAPKVAGTTALTYPYVIARVLSPSVTTDAVRFVQKL
jgi:hypothetical protein